MTSIENTMEVKAVQTITNISEPLRYGSKYTDDDSLYEVIELIMDTVEKKSIRFDRFVYAPTMVNDERCEDLKRFKENYEGYNGYDGINYKLYKEKFDNLFNEMAKEIINKHQ